MSVSAMKGESHLANRHTDDGRVLILSGADVDLLWANSPTSRVVAVIATAGFAASGLDYYLNIPAGPPRPESALPIWLQIAVGSWRLVLMAYRSNLTPR